MLGERFEAALIFATQRHSDQRRKGTEIPYISHLLSVAALVVEAGGGEDDAIAALLHDAVEDQKASLAEIREKFGEHVASVVDECSDTDCEPKPPWRARKDEFVAKVPSLSPSARMVTAADKLHNVRSILADYRVHGEAVWGKFNGGRDGTLWYYRAVVDALGDDDDVLFVSLAAAVGELEKVAAGGAG